MSFIQCPYCQSSHVRQTDSGNANSNYFEQLQRCISPDTDGAVRYADCQKGRLSAFCRRSHRCGGWRGIGHRQSDTAMKNITAMRSNISVRTASSILLGPSLNQTL